MATCRKVKHCTRVLSSYPHLQGVCALTQEENILRIKEQSGGGGLAEPIAIIGIACRHPEDIASPKNLWGSPLPSSLTWPVQ